MKDTIFALSSGAPPAAVALVRISGPGADAALEALAGRLPPPRRATLRQLRAMGEELDTAIVVRFPGPHSATGEDVAELHLHGGRAVVAAVLTALGSVERLRQAEAGEFTRRAFENGRIDLAEAEGLADLLEAETEAQRRAALALAGGTLSRQVEAWQEAILTLSAEVEGALDFSDEEDAGSLGDDFASRLEALRDDLARWLELPPAERLKDGIRVVIAGPPNVGKSSLLNALARRDAAITSPVPGTTRDLIEAPVAFAGVPFLLIDTAGLRETADEVEGVGVARALASVEAADILLWLGDPVQRPRNAITVQSKADLGARDEKADLSVSALTGEGLDTLIRMLIQHSQAYLYWDGVCALHSRHRSLLWQALGGLEAAISAADSLVVAEGLRRARAALDAITGRSGVESMLDALFGRFCIGK